LQIHHIAGRTWSNEAARAFLLRIFNAAIRSADPLNVLAAHLPAKPAGRCVVVGAGKAAAAMAQAVETAWSDVDLSGIVVAPYGYGGSAGRIRVLEAGHPVPDLASENAAREVIESVGGLTSDDLVLALISGGGSAAMALPAPGITLAEKQQTTRILLKSGLDIKTMNVVRRRLSGIKGGRLAAAAFPARVVTLGISDIPGDDPTAIASGPTLPGGDAHMDLSPVLARVGHLLPPAVAARLAMPHESVLPAGATEFRMIATPMQALSAAADEARLVGVEPIVLGDDLEGEASQLGTEMAALRKRQIDRPTVFISGGETTVTIGEGPAGRGGRNTEFLLALAGALDGAAGVWALAGDTDGEDGATGGVAGAVIDPDSVRRGDALGLDLADHLARHDSGSFFEAIGDLVVTGPTHTNVNDFRAILVVPDAN
jgi:hydroxypyruvate reductase